MLTKDQALILSDVIMQRLGPRERETRAIVLTAEEARAICDFLDIKACEYTGADLNSGDVIKGRCL